MSERSQAFVNKIWELRNTGADTEEKLVAAVLRVAAENIIAYTTQDGRIVLDKNDLLQLSQELEE